MVWVEAGITKRPRHTFEREEPIEWNRPEQSENEFK
jgi:hypothetical protein